MNDFVSAKKVTPPEETSAPALHGGDHEGSSQMKATSRRLGLCVLVFHLPTPTSNKNVPCSFVNFFCQFDYFSSKWRL